MTLDSEAVRRRLDEVRQRTLALVAPLDWSTLRRQHIPILSPMVWDLGHIGHFEEMWLLGRLAGAEPVDRGYAEMFDPTVNPRNVRDTLPLPDQRTLFDFLGRVRRRVLEGVGTPARNGDQALLADGFVYEMVAQHEEQHQETVLQALQVCPEPAYTPAIRRPLPAAGPLPEGMIEIPAGPCVVGTDRPGFAYDNERRAHRVELPAFHIDPAPVTNAQYLEFITDDGYRRRELWSEAGWRWRRETGAEAPLHWRRDGDRWLRRGLDLPADAPEAEPAPRQLVCHVCYWEAEAYARWAGKRLPSEAEWEKAALWDPETGRQRLYPWGDEAPGHERANLDQLAFGPAEAGAYPAGASAFGVHQMAGDVWEWTASDFTAYPGFAAFPYPEYSEVFFGSDYKVLRGGSWATRPAVARGTFRNWDYPIRRQIFSGIRCALDA